MVSLELHSQTQTQRHPGRNNNEAVSEETCEALLREMQPYIEKTKGGSDSYQGKNLES